MTATSSSFDVVIVGGGFAGISVAARLRRIRPQLTIAVIEPSEQHFYQPAWTLVGGGAYPLQRTCRSERTVIPRGCTWIRARCVAFETGQQRVSLEDGRTVRYRMLVVASGLQCNWEKVEGLVEALGKNGVSSNYAYDHASYTWECLQRWQGGRAVFTQPRAPFKCAGAPQKILYLAADHWRKSGIDAELDFYNAGAAMFSVPFYAEALDGIMAQYGARAHPGCNLVAVDGSAKTAWFERETPGGPERESVQYDFLHVVPPQGPPEFIRQSPLSDAGGWVEVDKHTLQQVAHENIFSLGDCCSAPTSKTAAAVKNQVPVVVENLLCVLENRAPASRYDGYASCPLVTSRGRVMLAEFCYDGQVTPSFPFDPRVPRKAYWALKKHLLPRLYWNVILRGYRWPRMHKARSFAKPLSQVQA
jgi:sulfide:quinone oxidoreductase